MYSGNNGCCFKISGLAALSDISTPEHQHIFSLLETEQNLFLQQDDKFRSPEYKWPHDPLHTWSRVWEYPYVYYHVENHIRSLASSSIPVIADVGSGVTFFPFALAKKGCEVICTDIDPICGKDFSRASKIIPHSPGKVTFRLIDDSNLPLSYSQCDIVYCISVLEHIEEFHNMIREIARTLKTDGLAIITCDINLNSRHNRPLNVLQYQNLMSLIDAHFIRACPDRIIHPLNMLTTKNSKYSLQTSFTKTSMTAWNFTKQKLLKPLLRRTPCCAVLGLVLKKKSAIS